MAVGEADDPGVDVHVARDVDPLVRRVLVDHERIHFPTARVEFLDEHERGVGLLDGALGVDRVGPLAGQVAVDRVRVSVHDAVVGALVDFVGLDVGPELAV